MKVVVKVNTKNIKDYINAGCNAFIFCLKNLSSFTKESFSIKEISDIKHKYKDLDIYVSIDKHIFNRDISYLKDCLKELDFLDIKGIMFYDLSILQLKQELNLKTDLIWAPNFLVTNYKTCNFYQKLGVSSVVISNCILLSDIEKILKNVKFSCFINAFGYQLMSLSDRKLVSNYFKEIKETDNKKNHYMKENGRKFEIVENENCTFTLSDKVFDISSCIKSLNKYNPNLILDEISIPHTKFIKILKIYLNNPKKEEIEKVIKTDLMFLNTNTIVRVKK